MTLIYLYAINERAKSGKTISPHVVTRMINSEEAILFRCSLKQKILVWGI